MKVTSRNLFDLPDGRYPIEQNLQLYVRNGGKHRTFIFRYQFGRTRHDISLGAPPAVTVTAAKQEAAKCRALIAKGIDPKNRRDEFRREQQEKQITFGDFWQPAMQRIFELRRFAPTTRYSWETSLKNHALPCLKDVPMRDITMTDVLAVLSPIWETKTPIAMKIRSRLQTLFAFAQREGYMDAELQNPAVWENGLETVLPAPSKITRRRHNAAYTLDELQEQIKKSLIASTKVHISFVFGALTATRQREFSLAEWDEIDLEKAIWSIPPERRKDRRSDPFRVPLSRQAVDLLKGITRQPGNKYVFAGSHYNGKPVARYYVSTLIHYASDGRATMHGCRSTFKDWAVRSGYDWTLTELSLMHKVGSSTAQAYFHDDLLERRRPLMQAWADAILPPQQLSS